MSQKRAHDEMEQPEASVSFSTSPVHGFHQSFSSVFDSHGHQQAFADNSSNNFSDQSVRNGRSRQVSFMPQSPTFGPALPPRSDPSSINFSYNLPEEGMNWSASSHEDDMFRHVSQDSDNSSATVPSYNPLAQGMMDDSLMAYGSTLDSLLGLQQPMSTQGDTPPTSSFATTGLPFAGLDFIRNYTPGGYGDGQDGLWQGFDGGEFRYDPDLPFSLGELMEGES